jgi:hypothetical protein
MVRTTCERLAVGDVDGDGDLDFEVDTWQGDGPACDESYPPPAGAPCHAIHVNDGSGHFVADFTRLPASTYQATENPSSPLLFDLDADGDLDLLARNNWIFQQPWIGFWENDGSGHFSRGEVGWLPRNPGFAYAAWPVLIPLGLDQDGTEELVGPVITNFLDAPERFDREESFANLLGRVTIFRRTSPSGPFVDASADVDFPAKGFNYITPATGDLNGDGRPDLVIDGPSAVEFFFATAAGGLERIGRIFHSDPGSVSSVGDIDADGDIDLVTSLSTASAAPVNLYLDPGLTPSAQPAEDVGEAAARSEPPGNSRSLRSPPGHPESSRAAAPSLAGEASGDGPTAWVVSAWDRSLFAVDLGTTPAAVSGALLEGTIGEEGLHNLDVEAIPGQRRIGVTSQRFERGALTTVDVSAPAAPIVSSDYEQNLAGDLAVSASPELGFPAASGIYSIRTGPVVLPPGTAPPFANYQGLPPAWPFQGSISFATPDVQITCVAIAPDRRPAIFCDRKGNRIVFGDLQFRGLDPST